MSEALEYRIMSLKRFVALGIALFLEVMAFATGLLYEGTELIALAGILVMVFGGLILWAAAVGMSKDGYCRRVIGRISGGYDDPPHKDWEKSLEERGAFGGEQA